MTLTPTDTFLPVACGLLIYMARRVNEMMYRWNEIQKTEFESRQYVMDVTHFNSVGIRHTLNALRPYIVSLMNHAVENENYTDAATCRDMLKNMDEIIQQPL